MHLNSELLFKKYALTYFRENLKVLEIGASGVTKYQKIINNENIIWHTLDIGPVDKHEINSNVIVSSKEYNYPIEDNTYDIILSGQVLEHVKKIWIWAKELNRIVKKDGHVISRSIQ